MLRVSNSTLSVITRVHDPSRLEILNEVRDCLSRQTWNDLEWIIVTQRFEARQIQRVQEVVRDFGTSERKLKIENVAQPDGDIRAILLNQGISVAAGRYLAFLDFDDIWYPHAVQALIHAIQDSNCAWSVARVKQSLGSWETGKWNEATSTDTFAWGRDRIDLFADNFLPIHSFAIDRTRMPAELLRFDPSYTLLEDYAFLLPIAAQFEPAWTLRRSSDAMAYIGEYRFPLDGSNSNLIEAHSNPEKQASWDRAIARLRRETGDLLVSLPLRDVHEMAQFRKRWNRLSPHSQAFLSRSMAVFHRMDQSLSLRWIPLLFAKASGFLLRLRTAFLIRRHNNRQPSRQ